MLLSQAEQDRIAQAVTAAEARTRGEIYCVLAPDVSDYRETPIAWAAGAAIVLPGLLAVLRPGVFAELGAAWSNSPVAAALSAFVLAQALLFVLTAVIAAQPAVRRLLTPASLKDEKVRRAAMAEFLAKGLAGTEGRTGVLLFASMAERRAQVVADEGVLRVTPHQAWVEVARLLTDSLKHGAPADGFVAAVGKAGDILAAHVPAQGANPDELSNRIVIS